jgi:signal transduction histidine kinase
MESHNFARRRHRITANSPIQSALEVVSGVVHTPQSALLDIASVTNRPIVTDAESQLGYGAVGGFIGSLSSAAQEAARLAMRIFDGENASRIPVATIDIVKPIFDGRELKRWNIREDTLPSGSEIRYREFSIWEQYRWQIFAVFAALLFQAAMISGLLIERRRRRLAEVEAHQHMSELAHMNRVATVGELSASFAHEINQPLGAITANGSAALRWLTRATPDLDEARAAVTRVVNEGHRVAELVANIRSMFKKGDQKAVPLDVNELVRAALVMLQVEVEKHRVTIKTDLFAEIPRVSGDRIQLQQVLLNLLMNAMEAMDTLTGRERMLAVKSEIQEPDLVVVTVKDSGSGIDPENVDRIFNAFFTTKSRGMGMGLSICRSIIEAHGGTLSASPGHPHGAIFQIALRTSPPPPPMS